jgi:hypothetical protein
MRGHRDAHPRRPGLAAALTALLSITSIAPAAGQVAATAGQAEKPSGEQSTAVAPATVAVPSPVTPAAARVTPARPRSAERTMTAEERRQFMMLLILHETSRNPIGALH